jgi:glycerol-3-phosphate dehydrogenase subunit C
MHTVSWHSVSTTLDECIKCNICTSYCPVAAATDKFPGPKYVGPQAQRFREIGQRHSPDHWVDYCSACRVCNDVCPSGVKIAEINTRAKAQIVHDKGIPLRNWFLGRNEMLGRIGSYAPHLANLGMHNPVSRFMAEKVMGIARHAPIPRWSTQGTFEAWFKRTQDKRLKSDKQVVYFHGCSTEYYEPWIGQAAVAVLEHNGYEVIVPPQNCCGLPMLNNGEFPAAAKLYRSNLAKLLPYADKGYPIVGTSISCVLTLREEASEMMDIENDDTRRFKLALWDMMEFLRELHDNGELDMDFRAHGVPRVLPYHVSCQTRAHRMGRPALDVMSLIPGLDIREGYARCCGLAGTYGYKAEKYDIAMQVGQEAFDFINAQGPEARMVVSDSEICRWQLQHGTGKPSRHAIEVLAAAYGLYDLDARRLNDRFA